MKEQTQVLAALLVLLGTGTGRSGCWNESLDGRQNWPDSVQTNHHQADVRAITRDPGASPFPAVHCTIPSVERTSNKEEA